MHRLARLSQQVMRHAPAVARTTAVPVRRMSTSAREHTQSLLKNSSVRRDYEETNRRAQADLPMRVAQARAAMDIGADPVEEARPHVELRQQRKEQARKMTPPSLLNLIAERQQGKYGKSDPTAESLVAKQVFPTKQGQKALSPEDAAEHVIKSSTTPAPDFSGEFAKLADQKPEEWHHQLHKEIEGLNTKD